MWSSHFHATVLFRCIVPVACPHLRRKGSFLSRQEMLGWHEPWMPLLCLRRRWVVLVWSSGPLHATVRHSNQILSDQCRWVTPHLMYGGLMCKSPLWTCLDYAKNTTDITETPQTKWAIRTLISHPIVHQAAYFARRPHPHKTLGNRSYEL